MYVDSVPHFQAAPGASKAAVRCRKQVSETIGELIPDTGMRALEDARVGDVARCCSVEVVPSGTSELELQDEHEPAPQFREVSAGRCAVCHEMSKHSQFERRKFGLVPGICPCLGAPRQIAGASVVAGPRARGKQLSDGNGGLVDGGGGSARRPPRLRPPGGHGSRARPASFPVSC